jgi:hypothetical protein
VVWVEGYNVRKCLIFNRIEGVFEIVFLFTAVQTDPKIIASQQIEIHVLKQMTLVFVTFCCNIKDMRKAMLAYGHGDQKNNKNEEQDQEGRGGRKLVHKL